MSYRRGKSYAVSKRALDLVVTVPALAIAVPVLLVALLRRRSAELELSVVEMLGHRGRRFRTLHSNSAWVRHAARIIDVVRGYASVVGPRVLPAAELTPGSAVLREYAAPGLVCLQWLRWRSNVAFHPEEQSDMEYVERRSLRFDVSILLRAALATLYGSSGNAVGHHVQMLGVDIDNVSLTQALDQLETCIERQAHGTQVSFVNSDCLNKAARDGEYRRALNASNLVLADGVGIKMAGALLGRTVRQNVNGTDLFPRLCERLNRRGGRLFLLGGRAEVVAAVAQYVRREYPQIELCGAEDGFFENEEAVVRRIRTAAPDVLLVALGAPLQEMFIARNRHRMGARVCVGVGGLFDFYSGRIPRAPQWLREAGLEWTYRLYQEPGRMWRRYLIGNVVFLSRVFAEKCGIRSTDSRQVVLG